MAAQVGFDMDDTWVRNRQKDLQNTVQHLAEILRRDGDLTHKRIKVQTRSELLGLKVGLVVGNPLNSKILYVEGIGLRFRLRVQNNTHAAD